MNSSYLKIAGLHVVEGRFFEGGEENRAARYACWEQVRAPDCLGLRIRSDST